MASLQTALSRRCCRCNRTAKCVRCACVRNRQPCGSCLPRDHGRCQNRLHSPSRPVQTTPSSLSAPVTAPASSTSPSSAPSTGPPVSSASGPLFHPITSTLSAATGALPPLSTIFQAHIPTLQHVPKGARDCWAKVLSACLSSITLDPDDLEQWTKLFMLPKCVLVSPSAGHRLPWREILQQVKSRLRRWTAGDHSSLWSEAVAEAHALSSRIKPSSASPTSQRNHNARRARMAVQDGLYRKAIKALTSEGLASASPEVLREMLDKHPQAPLPTLPLGPVPPPLSLPDAGVLRAVKSFPSGSAPGPSGLRPSHLREAICCPAPDLARKVLTALTSFVNALAAGRTPQSILPHLCGATLLACRKKNGGLRPIAVGEVLRRLISKCLASASRHTANRILAPLQLGVSVKGGCEAIIHSVSQLVASAPPDRRWTLLLDFRNAFNSIDRESMFKEVRQRTPGLAAWLESCYSTQPLLHLGSDTIHSCCGVQQGDPLGPLGFAITLQPIVERIKDEVPGLNLNSWYLDDGTLMGSPEDLAAALNIIENDGPAVGLLLNREKSLLYIPQEEDASISPLPSEIPVTRQGFTLLGCPIGPPSFCEESLLPQVEKIKMALDRLGDLGDSQLETTLLRSCLSLPKLSFTLRTCPPSHICHAASDFDQAVRECLERIIGGPISQWSWLKASLPSSRGGLNLRNAALHAPAAFLGSSQLTWPLVKRILGFTPGPSSHVPSAMAALAAAANRPDWVNPDAVDVPIRQHSLSVAIDEAIHGHLLSTAPDTRSKALALSSGLAHAGDWLNVVPSAPLGLHIHDQEFRCSLRYWLGIPLHGSTYKCNECGRQADTMGDHQVGCGGNSDRISRHNNIRDVLFSAAQSAALGPRKEAPGIVPNSSARPADVLLPNWSRGRQAALDVSVISPLQQLTLAGAAVTPGHALQVCVRRKLSANLPACRAAGMEFVPVVVEVLGGLAPEASSTIRKIGDALGRRANPSCPSQTTRHLFGRLAIALWRGNATLWLRRAPSLPPSADGII